MAAGDHLRDTHSLFKIAEGYHGVEVNRQRSHERHRNLIGMHYLATGSLANNETGGLSEKIRYAAQNVPPVFGHQGLHHKINEFSSLVRERKDGLPRRS